MLQPKMMIVAQPTWGVDVGAAQLIRQALIDLRDAGVALSSISEELDELFTISDRLSVLAAGRLSPSVKPAETSIEQIGVWMSGNSATRQATARLPQVRNWRLLMLRLQRRATPSSTMSVVSPLLAAAGMLVTGFLLFSALGKDPVEAFYLFFYQAAVDPSYGIGELLLKTTPMGDFVDLGLAWGFCANVWNIGAEGQLTMGAIAGGGVALWFGDSELNLRHAVDAVWLACSAEWPGPPFRLSC